MSDRVIEKSHQSIKAGSKSFAAASRLFDRAIRDDCALLYAFCRHCDDVIDGQEMGYASGELIVGEQEVRLAALHRKTEDALLKGQANEDTFRALGMVAARHAIPLEYPLALLRGFAMDVQAREYETLDDVLDYAYHVAGVVGVMMAHIMGVRDEATLDRASDLGIAFQLTNIARDIRADAQIGRIYLPRCWLEEAGISATDVLSGGADRDRLFAVALRLLDAAEPYYRSAAIGERALPPRCAWTIGAARRIYQGIGKEIRRIGPAALDNRVSTSHAEKLTAIIGSAVRLRWTAAKTEGLTRPLTLFQRPTLENHSAVAV